uniref:C-type lectin domain-containing protein n=1 Tax=Loa loa TaxID=7209 RepID=A0A1I7VZP5_LOALO
MQLSACFALFQDPRNDGWTGVTTADGRTDGGTDERNGWTNGQMDGWTNGQMEWIDRTDNEWMNGSADE